MIALLNSSFSSNYLHPLPIVSAITRIRPNKISKSKLCHLNLFLSHLSPSIKTTTKLIHFHAQKHTLIESNQKADVLYSQNISESERFHLSQSVIWNKSVLLNFPMAAAKTTKNVELEKNGTIETEITDISEVGRKGEENIDRFYFLIDIGANLTNKKFSRDLDSVVQRAKEAGVLKIMVTGTNILVSKEALRLTRLFPDTLFSTAGIHPHDAKTFDETSIQDIESLCSNPEVVALGECGLDFNRNFSPPEVQLEVFEKQVELACRLKKPLFLHERDAFQDLVAVLKKYHDKLPPSVLHCFTGTVDQAKVYVELGLYIGLTGYVWKDKSEDGVRKMLLDNVVPLDKLLLETDAPFMYPNFRSAKLTPEMKQVLTPRSLNYLNRHCTFQRNEPCSLPATLEMISALMGKDPEEVAMAMSYNAVKIFGLSN